MEPTSSPLPILPLLGILSRHPLPTDLEPRLEPVFGTPLLRSRIWDFTATDYYEPEMGAPLKRSFLAFSPAVARLVAWKHATRELERRWADPHGRRVNLDPGYIDLGGLFLASTKPGVQRVYLDGGIYAEITLFFRRNAWERLPWTFPDFRSGLYDGFLHECRRSLTQLRAQDRLR